MPVISIDLIWGVGQAPQVAESEATGLRCVQKWRSESPNTQNSLEKSRNMKAEKIKRDTTLSECLSS